MFLPGDTDFSNVAGYRAEVGWSEVSPRLVALAAALNRLLAASDGVAEALTRHDRGALESSNELATALVEEVGDLAGTLTDEDRTEIARTAIPGIREKLAAAARRNAYLIEQAWAVDAALMRLMIGVGRVGPEGPVGGYSAPTGPAYLDRGA
jgi:hypothetical protein